MRVLPTGWYSIPRWLRWKLRCGTLTEPEVYRIHMRGKMSYDLYWLQCLWIMAELSLYRRTYCVMYHKIESCSMFAACKRSCGKVMFSHVFVCSQRKGWSDCSMELWKGRHHQKTEPPPPEGRPPISLEGRPRPTPRRYSQQAGGTHPIGMHTCVNCKDNTPTCSKMNLQKKFHIIEIYASQIKCRNSEIYCQLI